MYFWFYIYIFGTIFTILILFFLLSKSKNEKDFFSFLINNLNKIVVITDKNGKIVYKNRAFNKKILSNIDRLDELKVLGKNSIKEPFFKYLINKKDSSIKTVIYLKNKNFPSKIKKFEYKNRYFFLITDISSEENYVNQINKIYYFDNLTNLPNQASFYENLQILLTKSVWNDIKFTLVILEISNFTNIINFLGIEEGNNAIKKVGEILKNIYKNTQIYKFEDSKFAIIFNNIDSSNKLKNRLKPFLNIANNQIKINSHEIDLDLKIGAVFYPYFNVDKDTLIKYAKFALTDAKKNREKIVIFTNSLKEKLENRDLILNNLPKAIKNSELELYFQPKLNMFSFKINSAEVLIRWNHPKFGYISPSKFIPLAEKTSIILDIGEFVIDEAFKYLQHRKKLGLNSIQLAINISQKQLTQQNIVKILKDKLNKYDLTPDQIELEITESSIMKNENLSLSILENLKNLGFTISLDDFGTGYSSLNLLSKLPIHKLKIDRTFINKYKNKKDFIILNDIASLAQKLNLKIVIEGIETNEQLLLAKKLKCYEVQGFLVSKPLDKQKFSYFINNHKLPIKYNNLLAFNTANPSKSLLK